MKDACVVSSNLSLIHWHPSSVVELVLMYLQVVRNLYPPQREKVVPYLIEDTKKLCFAIYAYP